MGLDSLYRKVHAQVFCQETLCTEHRMDENEFTFFRARIEEIPVCFLLHSILHNSGKLIGQCC